MLNIIKKAGIINRANDEILYEYVLDEMEQGVRIKGLWAKALAHSDGLEAKAKSMYMQYRVQSIKDQFDALKIAYDEMSRKRLFDYIKNGFKEPVQEIKKIEEVKETKKVEKPKVTNENHAKAKEQTKKEDSDKYDDYQSEIAKLRTKHVLQETKEEGFHNMMIGYFIILIIVFLVIIINILTN